MYGAHVQCTLHAAHQPAMVATVQCRGRLLDHTSHIIIHISPNTHIIPSKQSTVAAQPLAGGKSVSAPRGFTPATMIFYYLVILKVFP